MQRIRGHIDYGQPVVPSPLLTLWNDNMQEAPKDGTYILLWGRALASGHVVIGRWASIGWFVRPGEHGVTDKATHWMPLPAPPTT